MWHYAQPDRFWCNPFLSKLPNLMGEIWLEFYVLIWKIIANTIDILWPLSWHYFTILFLTGLLLLSLSLSICLRLVSASVHQRRYTYHMIGHVRSPFWTRCTRVCVVLFYSHILLWIWAYRVHKKLAYFINIYDDCYVLFHFVFPRCRYDQQHIWLYEPKKKHALSQIWYNDLHFNKNL